MNDDGDMDDIYGGLIVNPSPLTLNYRDLSSNTLAPSQTLLGDGITDYTVGSLLAINADPTNNDLASLYYFPGETVTLTPQAINGYITPASQTITLGVGQNQNTLSFVYAPIGSGGGDSSTNGSGQDSTAGTLADTGTNLWVLLGVAGLMIAAGLVVLRARVWGVRSPVSKI